MKEYEKKRHCEHSEAIHKSRLPCRPDGGVVHSLHSLSSLQANSRGLFWGIRGRDLRSIAARRLAKNSPLDCFCPAVQGRSLRGRLSPPCVKIYGLLGRRELRRGREGVTTTVRGGVVTAWKTPPITAPTTRAPRTSSASTESSTTTVSTFTSVGFSA